MTEREPSRRRFLQSLSFCAFPELGLNIPAPEEVPEPIVVQLFLKGGLDSLNALIPHSEAAYFDSRPNIAVQMKGEQLKRQLLNERFALHPSLSALLPLFERKRLAFVVAAGLPQAQRSHFDAQDICESGGGAEVHSSGWMTRALGLEATSPHRFDALCVGKTVARSLSEHRRVLVVPALNHFTLPGGVATQERYEKALRTMYPPHSADGARRAGSQALQVLDDLKEIRKNYRGPRNRAKYGRGALSGQFRTLAEMIRQKPTLRIASVSMGGWDTHREQGGSKGDLPNKLAQLGDNLAAFIQDLGPEAKRVVVVVMTEFGRTLRENGTRGTDHGYGSMMMVLGHRVQGGQILGKWPGLNPLQLHEGRELAVTTDYRHVLEEIRREHLSLRNDQSPFDLKTLGPGNMAQLFRSRRLETSTP